MVMKEKMEDGSTRLISGMTIAEITAAVLLAAYPVGAIYLTVNATNPGSLMGGTWVAWGAGRVPVGINTLDVSFDTVEEVGGAKTHSHDLDSSVSGARIRMAADTGLWAQTKALTNQTQTRGVSVTTPVASPGNSTVGVSLEGLCNASSSLAPYIVCYMWKRTA